MNSVDTHAEWIILKSDIFVTQYTRLQNKIYIILTKVLNDVAKPPKRITKLIVFKINHNPFYLIISITTIYIIYIHVKPSFKNMTQRNPQNVSVKNSLSVLYKRKIMVGMNHKTIGNRIVWNSSNKLWN